MVDDVTEDEDALLRSVNRVLRQLPEAMDSGSPELLDALIADCTVLLEGPLVNYAEATRKVRETRGFARAKSFERSGNIGVLREGVEDLSAALDGAPGNREVGVSIGLGQALFRLGEQSGDLATLRRSVELFATLPEEPAADPFVVSTCATARMTIGTLTGDRQLVERAVVDLQAALKKPGLEAAAVAVLEQNLAIALLRNANQGRSARVYSETLAYLDRRLSGREKTPPDELLRIVQASARFEFSKITNDLRQLRRSELEVARLLKVFAAQPRRRLELLHQLGQSRFHRAIARRSTALAEAAIACLEEALALCGADVVDARRDRLFADLGYYSLHSSLLAGLPERMREAQRYFERALESITIERAPGLYVQVAKGLFELHFREQAFAEAARVAHDIELAGRFARADPRLTSGVLQQAPLEIVGVPERHAACLVRLGRLSEASVVLENSRAQHLAAALGRGVEQEAALPPQTRASLDAARVRLADQLRGRDDTSIRRAWEDYLTMRRANGLDLGSYSRDHESIQAAVPVDGALVQLCFTRIGSFALLWTKALRQPISVELPKAAWTDVGRILEGEPGGQSGWVDAYQRFLDQSLLGDAQLETATRRWSDVISGCLATLGEAIFEPLEAALVNLGLKQGAPLLLCPPGALALLPLSAAASRGALSDRWVVSVVPNALAAAITEGDTSQAQRTVCLHSPADSGGEELPMSIAEAAALKRLVPDSIEVCGKALDPSAALSAIRAATHVHIACHGVYDADNPSHSGLILANGERLTLTKLWAGGFEQHRVRLVFLSCCEGGVSGRTIDADEFSGLPAALLQLGVGGVIATPWAVLDDAARVFSEAYYRRYLDTSGAPKTSPAFALAEARRWMRSVTVATLIDEGYLSREDAEILFMGPALELRRLRRFESQRESSLSFPRESSGALRALEAQPYADACHWAGWTLFGR